jgi:small subunit ribosomal protein S5
MAKGRGGKTKSNIEKVKPVDKEAWQPKTRIGSMVKSGEITSFEQIVDMGKPMLEPEIIDVLLPDLEVNTLEVRSTQRVTDSGKRTKFRVAVVLGDRKGHVGIGVGKSEEMKPAIDYALKNAKKNVIAVKTGCGSWECRCGQFHSIPMKAVGKEGSTVITLRPAPKGLGLAANDVVKKVLTMAGIKDIWSQAMGGSNTYNMASATIKALDSLNTLRPVAE